MLRYVSPRDLGKIKFEEFVARAPLEDVIKSTQHARMAMMAFTALTAICAAGG